MLYLFHSHMKQNKDIMSLLTSKSSFEVLYGIELVTETKNKKELKEIKKIVKILASLTASTDITIRNQSIWALGSLKAHAKSSTDTLIRIVNNEKDKMIKNNAIFALGEIGENLEKVIPCLIKIAEDDDESAMNVFDAIALMGPKGKSALPFIERYINSNNNDNTAYARYAYRKITGYDYSYPREIITNIFRAIDAEDIISVRHCIKSNKDIINKLNNNGFTPLMFAISRDNEKISKLLIDSGSNVNYQGTKYGYTPLRMSAGGKRAITVKMLLQQGAKVNIQDKYGGTALMAAAFFYFGDTSILNLLLESGANPNIKNNKGQTALDLAIMRGHKEYIKILTKLGRGQLLK